MPGQVISITAWLVDLNNDEVQHFFFFYDQLIPAVMEYWL